ncbi:uncharacterized protein TNCV_789521 [Trichonephila clavipes]|nr:uncharacterized protein TNCV_789521 [Trichonephila clavipes]
MAPHTITLAVGAVCCCKAKTGLSVHHGSSFLVGGTTPNGGVKGNSRNGRLDTKCSSARRLHMVREDTENSSELWMAADKAVGCTRAFLAMWRSSRRLICQGRPEHGLRLNDISRIHWSQHLLTK